jgi:lipopolysaccharide export system ATP-binding protein
MSLLTASGLVKTYLRRRVVDGIEMVIQPGEIVGLLGPNGAGKSTCFKIICGLVRPDKGDVFLLGNRITALPLFQRGRLGMGYLPQHSSLFTKLTVEQNLIGMMQLLSLSRKQQKTRCEQLLEQFNIAHVRKSRAETLSGGERRRLEIARCLVADPKIIMLDEPFAAIDPVTVQNIQQVIRQLAQRDIAVLITDHAAREILQITDRTYVVSEGRILCSGSAEEIVKNEQVRQKYLGDLQLTSRPAPNPTRSPQTTTANHATIPQFARSPRSEPTDQLSRGGDEPVEEKRRPKIIFSDSRRRSADARSDLD